MMIKGKIESSTGFVGLKVRGVPVAIYPSPINPRHWDWDKSVEFVAMVKESPSGYRQHES